MPSSTVLPSPFMEKDWREELLCWAKLPRKRKKRLERKILTFPPTPPSRHLTLHPSQNNNISLQAFIDLQGGRAREKIALVLHVSLNFLTLFPTISLRLSFSLFFHSFPFMYYRPYHKLGTTTSSHSCVAFPRTQMLLNNVTKCVGRFVHILASMISLAVQ